MCFKHMCDRVACEFNFECAAHSVFTVLTCLCAAAVKCSLLFETESTRVPLGLAEVQLFNKAGTQMAGTLLTATLSSVPGKGSAHPASMCVDGKINTFCHTSSRDSKPQLRISFPCSEGLSKVRVTNRGDCCKENINAFHLHFLDATASNMASIYQFAGGQDVYTIILQGEGASLAGIFLTRISQ